MEATWMPIKGFEDAYEVSDQGEIRSIGRMRKRGAGQSWQEGQLMKQWTQGSYLYCDLRKNGTKTKARVHVVVLEAFIGKRPSGMLACHNNGDPLDNRLCNLRWATAQENMADKLKHGTHKFGSANPKAKLTELEAQKIKLATGTYSEIAKQYGVCKATVTHIKSGRNWAHLSNGQR